MRSCVIRWVAFVGCALWLGVALLRAQAATTVVAFTGTLATGTQEDRFTFELDPDRFTLNGSGTVTLIFVMKGTPGSRVNPGLITINSTAGRIDHVGLREADAAGTQASLTIASLTGGTYEIVVCSEHASTGAYQLDVFLAGDANGDLKVDSTDTALIDDRRGAKAGATSYSVGADVDRNGIIDSGDRERAQANLGAMVVSPLPTNPLETFLAAGALRLDGASPERFNSRTAPLRFRLDGAEFDVDGVSEFALSVNGSVVAAHRLTVNAHMLLAAVSLADGRNDIALKAYDTVGRPLYLQATLWAGSATLQVNVVNSDGTPFLDSVTVSAVLSADQHVAEQKKTTKGTAVFEDVPAHTILINVEGEGQQTGTASVIGSNGVVKIAIRRSIRPPER